MPILWPYKYNRMRTYRQGQIPGGVGGAVDYGQVSGGGGTPIVYPNLDEYSLEKTGANINSAWYGLDINPTGDTLFMVQELAGSAALSMPLTTNWDVGGYGTSDTDSSFNVTNRTGCRIQSNGTNFWSVTTGGRIYNQSMPTAWRITGTKTAEVSKLISSVAPAITSRVDGLFFKPDGTRVYTTSRSKSRIVECSMSSWNLSTLAHVQTITATNVGHDIFFTPDGSRVYLIGGPRIKQFNLSTPWDLSTYSITPDYTLEMGLTGTGATGVTFKPDFSKMYVQYQGGSGNYVVQQWTT